MGNDSMEAGQRGLPRETLALSADSQGRSLRRIRSSIAQGLLIGVAVFWAVALVVALEPVWQVLVLLPSAVLSVMLALYWQRPRRRLLGWSLILGTVTAVLGSWWAISPLSAGGVLIAGGAMIPMLSRYRVLASVVLVSAAVGISTLSLIGNPSETPTYVLLTVAFGTFWICIFSGAWWTMRVATELEEAHQARTQLALYRERYRIAADLHDIQGHTLHLVKLKTALATRLLRRNPEAAEHELHEVNQLVTETIDQAQSLAYGQQQLTLPAEIENAKNLLEATGAMVTIETTGTLPTVHEELVSLLLRETTTNILRHSEATKVEVSVNETGISIINNGARTQARPLRGLDTLRGRVSEAGGTLNIHADDGRFHTKLRFPDVEIGR